MCNKGNRRPLHAGKVYRPITTDVSESILAAEYMPETLGKSATLGIV